jgi:hypothetical protein
VRLGIIADIYGNDVAVRAALKDADRLAGDRWGHWVASPRRRAGCSRKPAWYQHAGRERCADGFEAAYWRRPDAYLDPQVWRPMSALALIPDADREHGIRRLRGNLGSGEWRRRWGHLLTLDELDLGYRVVIARP